MVTKVYPIGTIFLSVINTNPGTYISGTTWVSWGSGRVPVGVNTSNSNFNSVEKTGGSDSHSYTPAGSVSKPTFTGTKATLSHSGGAVGNTALTMSQIPRNFWSADSPGTGGARVNTTFNPGSSFGICCDPNSKTGGNHNHSFTQPTAHTYTPAGTNSQPTFTGTAATQSHLQQYITCYMWKRTA